MSANTAIIATGRITAPAASIPVPDAADQAAAWNEGQTMPLEQVLDYALADEAD